MKEFGSEECGSASGYLNDVIVARNSASVEFRVDIGRDLQIRRMNEEWDDRARHT